MTDSRPDHTVDQATFRQVLGHYPTGVCAVTAMVDNEPVGMIVGSFTSLSLDPPLVAFMPDKASSTFSKLRNASVFVANILSSTQDDDCRTLASKSVADKWADISWHASKTGAPILSEAVAWIECDFVNTVDGGDHWIVIGRVRDLAVQSDVLPLLFFQGDYGRFSPASFIARMESDLLPELEAAEAIRDELEALARISGLECTAAARIGREVIVVARSGNPAGSNPRRAIGLRIPFVPPMASLFCAWDPQVFDLWIEDLAPTDPDIVGVLREQVALVRRRGWSLALRTEDRGVLDDLLHDFTIGKYTPSKERELRSLITSLHDRFDPPEVHADRCYDLNSLRAPVFDAHGRVVLSVQLIGPTTPSSGHQVNAWRDLAVEATDRMTLAVGGRRPDPDRS